MRNPDLESHYAKAWMIDQGDGMVSNRTGLLTSWHVYSEHFHPFWRWWCVGVIHLRDIPGLPEAVKRGPDATHEFFIYSVHPDAGDMDPNFPPPSGSFLYPPDLVKQVDSLDDTSAVEIVTRMIEAIVQRCASPDSDFRRWWGRVIDMWCLHARKGDISINRSTN